MKIVLFNNGKEIKVSDEIADQVGKRLINGDAKNWKMFIDNGSGLCTLIINLTEVSCIYSNESII